MEILEKVNGLVWGVPVLSLILVVGIMLSVRTGWIQFRLLPEALRRLGRMLQGKEGKSSYRSLCTALGATVGTGNLVGVAGAICLGGPGSIFWMWICGILGMVTKYAEVVLSVRYRIKRDGQFLGGPMYLISRGMGKRWHWMACLYSFFGIVAALGVGNATQINALVTAVNGILGQPEGPGNVLMGIGLAMLVGLMLSGGADRIGAAAEKLVPFAAGGYILLCVCVLLLRMEAVGAALLLILQGAFSPGAVTGGVVGSAFSALRIGCARGVFTNEAGMGTAAIAHAGAQVTHPVDQGMMGIVEVFLDTIVICTLTALVILVSGVPIPYGEDVGGRLTTDAFTQVLGSWTGVFLACAMGCFAFATILGWGLYGMRCAGFLLGKACEAWFVWLQMGAAFLGTMLKTGPVWTFSEMVNGLMALPNLVALALLTKEVVWLTRDFSGK